MLDAAPIVAAATQALHAISIATGMGITEPTQEAVAAKVPLPLPISFTAPPVDAMGVTKTSAAVASSALVANPVSRLSLSLSPVGKLLAGNIALVTDAILQRITNLTAPGLSGPNLAFASSEDAESAASLVQATCAALVAQQRQLATSSSSPATIDTSTSIAALSLTPAGAAAAVALPVLEDLSSALVSTLRRLNQQASVYSPSTHHATHGYNGTVGLRVVPIPGAKGEQKHRYEVVPLAGASQTDASKLIALF
jgi:hypothetical protein